MPLRLNRLLSAAAIVFAAASSACSDSTAPVPQTPIDQFDAVWKDYDTTYAYFNYKKINWDSLRGVYRPQAAAAASTNALAAVVQRMLGELRDVHAWLTDPVGTQVGTYAPTRFVNWQRDVWLTNMSRIESHPQPTNWGYARLGNVPYLYFGAWNPKQFTAAAVDSVFEQFRDAPAMIIDIRMNGGGDNSLAYAIAGRFFDATHVVAYVQYRNGPKHSDLGPQQAVTVSPRGAWQFTKPVLVLIGRGCFSSSEDFIAAMSSLKHVTLAGDTTGGGSGNPRTSPLGSGWSYSVPRWIEYTAAMQVIEWRGIAPNVVVPASSSDFNVGRDPVFDYAVSWAAKLTVSAARQGRGARR